MNLKNAVFAVVAALSVPAFAADVNCPAGTRAAGGPKTPLEASMCVKSGADGSRIFHGPYVGFWPNGVKQAEGQYEEGWRTGTWTFFDEKGLKTGVTTFKHGDYDGVRVEFHPNGQKKLEENYVMGIRQGSARTFDLQGKEIGGTGNTTR